MLVNPFPQLVFEASGLQHRENMSQHCHPCVLFQLVSKRPTFCNTRWLTTPYPLLRPSPISKFSFTHFCRTPFKHPHNCLEIISKKFENLRHLNIDNSADFKGIGQGTCNIALAKFSNSIGTRYKL